MKWHGKLNRIAKQCDGQTMSYCAYIYISMINIDQEKVYYEVKTCETPIWLINAHNLNIYIYIYTFLNAYNINISSFFYTRIIPYLTLRRFPLIDRFVFLLLRIAWKGEESWCDVCSEYMISSRLRLIIHFFVRYVSLSFSFTVTFHLRFTIHFAFIFFNIRL